MMKFHSTGEYFKNYKPDIKNSTTIPQIASPDKSARMLERNYVDSSKYNFKPITTQAHETQAYIESFNRLNNSYQNNLTIIDRKFFNYPSAKPSQAHLNIITGQLSNQTEISFYSPNHIQNFNMLKAKHWANKLPSPSCENKSQIIKKDAYTNENLKNLSFNKNAISNLNRTNLYVTNLDKQFKINKDFSKPSYSIDKRLVFSFTKTQNKFQSFKNFNRNPRLILKHQQILSFRKYANLKKNQRYERAAKKRYFWFLTKALREKA